MLSLYVIILFTILKIVQNIDLISANSEFEVSLENAFSPSNEIVKNKDDVFNDDLLMEESKDTKVDLSKRSNHKSDPTLQHLRNVLSKFLRDNKVNKRETVNISDKSAESKKSSKRSDGKKSNMEPKWDVWNSWSPCSVSCGKGRHIRWRHCMKNCDGVETEMQEKTCQLPACPHKLFGLIKI